jgi:hypothetical protein
MKHSLTLVIAGWLASAALLLATTSAVAQPQVDVAINIGVPVLSPPVIYRAPQPVVYMQPQTVYVEQKVKYKKFKKDKHGKHHGHDHDED